MHKLKMLGLDSHGLKIFYKSNMNSLLITGVPARHTLLSGTCKQKIERVQRSATRVIHIYYDYDEHLSFLCLPKLNISYICYLRSKYFGRTAGQP